MFCKFFKENIWEVCKNGNIWVPQNLTPVKLGAGGLSDDRSSKGPCYIRILKDIFTKLFSVSYEAYINWKKMVVLTFNVCHAKASLLVNEKTKGH